jgi:hypothetical protein
MSFSLGKSAIVDTLYYTTLVPPVGGGGGENLQQTCDIGSVTTTPITCDSLTATLGNITTSSGDMICAGDITSVSGDIDATIGKINAGTSIVAGSDITATNGDIVATAGDIVATVGKVTSGANMDAGTTITAGTGITSTNGDIVSSTGNLFASRDVEASSLTIRQVDTSGTSLLFPLTNGSPGLVPNLTNITKGSYWVYSATTKITFLLETSILRPVEACSFHVSVQGSSSVAPATIMTDYLVAPDTASTTKVVVEVNTNQVFTSGRPIRVNVLMIRDA